MQQIYPILLAGGSGTRLWPVSRKSYPKQFAKIIGDETLFQSSAKRLTSSEVLKFRPHITVTNSDSRFIVTEQLQEITIDPEIVIIEPESKNTAAPILAASILAHSKDEDATLLVAPSDHVIPDVDKFHRAISIALRYAEEGKIVTFGIQPTHVETGYGYLQLSTEHLDKSGTSSVISFVEKPDFSKASEMLETRNFLWNAGIFLFKAKDMINAFKIHAPEGFALVKSSVDQASNDLGFLRLAAEPWSKLSAVSIDFEIMEKAENLVAVPYKDKWSDLGGWDAVWSESIQDEFGNSTSESAHVIDCHDTLMRAESGGQHLAGLGLKNIMAIAMPDAVLIAHKDRAQDVKKVVNLLKTKHIPQAEIFPKDHRPWGWFESLVIGDRFQVKRIIVKPGEALSLQSHHHRSEHWVVVEGTARVVIDEEVKIVSEGQSVYIPLGALHRMENPGKLPMTLIEVQIGSYLEEDDIVRYEDKYSRQ